MKVSVIDLGFNSLKLVSYEVDQDNSFVVFDQKSVAARLGEGLSQTGFLGNDPMHRAIYGLKFFKEVNEFNGVRQSLPVATSAVREAANSKQFLNSTFSETGFRFRVLSGKEEALYSFTGAARALDLSEILFFDIGGGSVEFVYSRDSKVRKILSLPLGGLRLTQQYGESDSSFKEKAWDKMGKRILELLPSVDELSMTKNATLVGVGGNLRALARWDQDIRNYPFDKLHNYSLKRESIESMTKELSNLSANEIADIGVIGKERAQTLAAGALVVKLIMRKLGFRRLIVSTHGLRDGILASFLDDPVAYHRGSLAKTIRKTLSRRKKKQVAEKFLDSLEGFDLIDARERQIVSYQLAWISRETQTLKPDQLFYMMMDDDCFLSHRDQLIASISAVESRRSRSADWLYSRYKPMLKGKKNKEAIKKLASLSQFLELMLRSGSKSTLIMAENGSFLKLKVRRGSQKFPEVLFEHAIREMGDGLDRFIEYSIKHDSPKIEGISKVLREVGEKHV